MNIGVMSDTHGSLTAWVKAVNDYFSKVDLILHGDGLTEVELGQLAEQYRLDILITAHTHIHQIRELEGFIILDPGFPPFLRAMAHPPSDTLARVIDLEGGDVPEFITW